MVNKNNKFYEQIRNRTNNPKLNKFYEKIFEQQKQQKEEIDYYMIHKPYLDKMKKELEEEKFDLQQREKLKGENLDFLSKQITNNKLKRELLEFEQ